MKSPLLACCLGFLITTTALAQTKPAAAAQASLVESYGKLPLSFEANQGQTDPSVKFLSRGAGYTLFLTGNEAVFSLRGDKPRNSASDSALNDSAAAQNALPGSAESNLAAERRKNKAHGASRGCAAPPMQAPAGRKHGCDPDTVAPEANTILRMKLLHANPAAKITGADELPGKSNYFIGHDPKQWHSKVATYGKVKYEAIYSGIDLVYYGNQHQLEYDFVVAPGANPHRIQFDVRGARHIRQDNNGDMVLQTAVGEVRWLKPVVYQEKDGIRQAVNGRYTIKRGRVGFALGSYDPKRSLIIDPALAHSTYLGGTSDDSGNGIAVDRLGNIYIVGTTYSTDFPTTPGVFQAFCQRFCTYPDVFVTKLNPSGSALVYSTYLGGGSTDIGHAIAINASGDAYITGGTNSVDFPVTSGTFQATCSASEGLSCAFVTELNPSGSGLIYSTYLGGLGGGYAGAASSAIALDGSGDAFITGSAEAGLPTTPGAFQSSLDGASGAFVTEFNPSGSALVYSTYLGGKISSGAQAIALGPSGNVYVVGVTYSPDFPVTPGAFEPTCKGCLANGSYGHDGFVTEFNFDGSALVYSTYLGGSGYYNGEDVTGDEALAVAVDSSGNAYITGQTTSTDFPTTPGAFQINPRASFLTQLNSSGTDAVYSTYFGGSGFQYSSDGSILDAGLAIAIDPLGDAYVAGLTCSYDFPTTPGAFQPQANVTWPCAGFLSEMNPEGNALLYSSFLGGTPKPFYAQQANAMALDSSGNVYIAGQTSAPDFPITPGEFQAALKGTTDAFFTEFVPGPQLWPAALIFPNQGVGTSSKPQTATVTNDDVSTPLSVTQIDITGPNQSDFAQTNNCPVGGNLAPGASCTVSATFAPTAGGIRTARVSITDSGPHSPQSIGLYGTGIAGSVTLSPPSLNFGDQPLGLKSSPLESNLTNIGPGVLTITSIVVTGADVADFHQTNTCSPTIQPGASCQINVTFKPTALGSRSAAVTITDSATDSPQSLPLTGNGTAPAVMFSPSSLNFGLQPVGTTSLPQTVTVTASAAISISAIAASAQFAQTNNCGSGIPAGGSCTINVTFTPTSVGPQTGTLSVTDSGGNSPQSVPLSGTGSQGAVTLVPTQLNFGNQTVNLPSAPQTSNLINSGNGTLHISSINLGGLNASDFTEKNNCGTSLPAGEGCTITVTFTPSATSKESATVTITDDAPNSPQTLPLTGTGVLPAVTFSPTSLTFPTQIVFTDSPAQKVTLTNTGLGVLKIKAGGISGQFGQTTNCTLTLAPGASCTANVIFKPTTKGTLTGDISITDNAPGSPQSVPLAGTGTYVQIAPTSINFGNQPTNTTSLPKFITFTNKGSGPVNFTGSGITIIGTNAGDFAQTNDCGTSVARGASCHIKVTFTPSALGKRTAEVSISDDGGASPQMVTLTGTGTP